MLLGATYYEASHTYYMCRDGLEEEDYDADTLELVSQAEINRRYAARLGK